MTHLIRGTMLFLFFAVSSFASAQNDVRLSDASFQQIVEELKLRFRANTDEELLAEMRRRLDSVPPGNPVSRFATPDLSCNGKYLVIGLTNEFGQRETYSNNITTPALCQDQVRFLDYVTPNRVNRMHVLGYCSTTYLVKVPLLPTGKFGQPSQVRYSSGDECLAQQRRYYDDMRDRRHGF